MLSEELLRQVKMLELRVKKIVSEQLSGDFASVFHGRGIDFSELREYAPGDDVRSIDWNVTARSQVPHVKVYREDRELSVVVVLDRSASFLFGSSKRTKEETATQVAALIAYLTFLSNDRCGLLIFTDQVEVWIPPSKGKAHIWNILRNILEYKPKNVRTQIAVPVEHLLKKVRNKSTVFFISDFEARGFEDSFRKVSLKHKVYGICINDPSEKNLPDAGHVRFTDRETAHRVGFNTSSLAYKETYDREVKSQDAKLLKTFRTSRGGFLTITTSDDIGYKLRGLLGSNT